MIAPNQMRGRRVNSVIEFLNDADNRAVLSWIGGGVASIAGGLWIVLKYFLNRKKIETKKSGPGKDLSVSVGHGVAIGGNARVRIEKLRVSSGLQTLFWIGLLLLVLSLFAGRVWDALRSATTRIPSFALEVDCHLEDEDIVAEQERCPLCLFALTPEQEARFGRLKRYAGHELTSEEIDRFIRLRQFAEHNNGAVVYLSLRINLGREGGGVHASDQ